MRPFYLDNNLIITFPKRSIYDTTSHEVWFRDEGIPLLGTMRGYFFEDHILLFVDDFNIPPIHPASIMEWFNTYKKLSYVQLGCNRIDDKQIAKLVIFRGESIKYTDDKKEEEPKEDDKTLLEEAVQLENKNEIGFKKNEDDNNK